ncbi:MAG: PEGA domain-containing protein [Patescibacteria group bacterium]|nr:PEGA domain-containing protein [Patescibacteria group bacterium]
MDTKRYSFPHSPLKIFGFFLVAGFFVLIATLLIASAKGYKFEIKNNRLSFQKTGTIILTSQPSGGKVYVNGKLNPINSGTNLFPTSIKGLLSGKYSLKIEREGYIVWEKTVDVLEETVTWANYIVLFPKEAKKETVLNGNITLAKESDDSRHLAALAANSNTLELYTLDTINLDKTKNLTIDNSNATKPKTEILDINWSHDNSKILLTEKEGDLISYDVLNLRDNSQVNITDLFKFNFDKITWNPVNSDQLFGLKEGNIYRINSSEKTISASILGNVLSFEPETDRNVYAIRNIDNEISLWKADFSGNNPEKVIKSLPKSKNYKSKLSPNGGRLLIAIDGEVKTVYLADQLGGSVKLTQLSQEATDAKWSPNGRRIMIRNDKNIWVYDIEKEKNYQAIKDTEVRFASWDDGNDHLVTNLAGEYKVIEYDGGYPIKIGNSSQADIFFSPNNRNYFFISPEQNEKGKLIVYVRE